MKIESSLFDNVKEDPKIPKTNIEHEPTKTFRENEVNNVAELNERSNEKSQFFLAGSPKQPNIESALFLSGSPIIRGKESGALKNAGSRSNIKQAENGYTWQQYMPYANYIWEKQSHIPSEKSTPDASTTYRSYNRNDEGGRIRGNIYGNDGRGMLNTNVDNEGAYRLEGANGMSHLASQKQSLYTAFSTGAHVTEAGVARSEVQKSKSERKPTDSSPPTKSPAVPNTELGIPQVIASEPNQKAISAPQSMLSKR